MDGTALVEDGAKLLVVLLLRCAEAADPGEEYAFTYGDAFLSACSTDLGPPGKGMSAPEHRDEVDQGTIREIRERSAAMHTYREAWSERARTCCHGSVGEGAPIPPVAGPRVPEFEAHPKVAAADLRAVGGGTTRRRRPRPQRRPAPDERGRHGQRRAQLVEAVREGAPVLVRALASLELLAQPSLVVHLLRRLPEVQPQNPRVRPRRLRVLLLPLHLTLPPQVVGLLLQEPRRRRPRGQHDHPVRRLPVASTSTSTSTSGGGVALALHGFDRSARYQTLGLALVV